MQEFRANEQAFRGYLALPPSGSGPGVLVFHAWWGLTPVFQGVCDRLAAAGFVALAPDFFHGATAQTIEEAERLSGNVDDATAGAETMAAVATLRSHPAVQGSAFGVIGFSFGAYIALELAGHRPEDLAAVVLFYGTGNVPTDKTQAAFLGHFAADDQFEPAEGVAAQEAGLREVSGSVTFYTYPGTGHWFFEEDQPAYNAEAAHLAWDRTLAFLHQHLE